MRPIDNVRAKLQDAGRETRGDDQDFYAQCPAHEDSTPSLHVTEALDGVVLLRCHRGCGSDAIVAALGLRMADLFPRSRTSWKRPPVLAPRREELTDKTARVLRTLRLLDLADQPWQLSLGFTCPCCGNPQAWMRGGMVLVVDCPGGCPQEAILFHLEVEAARARVPA